MNINSVNKLAVVRMGEIALGHHICALDYFVCFKKKTLQGINKNVKVGGAFFFDKGNNLSRIHM